MDEFRVPRRQLTDEPIIFPTGEAQLIVVERPCVHVLDVEDTHFAHDRSILLPNVANVDDSQPTLDDRRLTGLQVIYAALIHAEAHPEQKLLVVGHTDPSGSKSYNQTLSEKRAENVQLFLSGDREGWRMQSDAESHPDDVQHILKFQAMRAGWDCDPGPITGTMNTATKNAVGRFQERYNLEVDLAAAAGVDSPFKAKIDVDKDVGPQTWGAFFDVYCHELMRLLGIDAFAELQGKLAAMKGFDALPPSVGCGENIPFDSGRRQPFDPDERLDRPQHNPSDRRVELMFFDPEEQPDLVCHAGGGCDPSACPLYTTDEYCHREIGVPRGLKLAEVVMELRFEDPQGATHPLPPGIEVEVRFDDGSSETHVLLEDGRVSFVTARDKSSFDLALTTEDGDYVVLVPGSDGGPATTELVDRDEALARVDDGGRFFKLPEAFDTHDADWRAPEDVAFEDGHFVDLDSPSTVIGTRAAPAQIVLVPHWQHFRFEYFDRWRGKPATVPQPRPCQDDTPPLVLEGHLAHVDYVDGPADPPVAESVWDAQLGADTLHCLAWVQRRPPDAETPRELPDAECLARFVFPASTFIRTDGAPDAADAVRIIETVTDGHAHHEEVSKAGAPRLRYYDLPTQWWSRGYFARLASQAAAETRRFETITNVSTAADPYVIDLDLIVICSHSDIFDIDGNVVGDSPRDELTWLDADVDRFTIWDNRLRVWKPIADEEYFTDVTKLSPSPQGAVLFDHPPFTRLITRGTDVFDVFDARTPLGKSREEFPIGARVARTYPADEEAPFFSVAARYSATANDDGRGTWTVGTSTTMILRCCGVADDVEIFRIAQYASAFFDFAPTNPPRGKPITPPVPPATALAETRKSLRGTMRRWNGTDPINGNRTLFEVGPASDLVAKGFYHALLVRGHDGDANSHLYRINIVADARAFMNVVCAWERKDMQVGAKGGFTAAHEWGHGFGNPDQYIESTRNASLYTDGIRDRFRSPGCPYSFDSNGMMNGVEKRPRGYDFWHLALWMADAGHSFAGATDIAVRQGSFRYTTKITPAATNRALFPVISVTNRRVGAAGLCDLFAYCGGVDGFNGGDALHGATLAEPWDLVVIVRVKMAIRLQEDDHKPFEGGREFLRELEGIVHRVFNQKRRVVARGTFEGRSVRARILFSPRFIVRTFPTGNSDARKKYLASQELAANTAAAYGTKVTGLITENGIHCDITAVEDPDDHGITNAGATPRRANLDTDGDVEEDMVEIFGKLVGLEDPEDAEPNDYAPVADLLGPTFARTSLEFVE